MVGWGEEEQEILAGLLIEFERGGELVKLAEELGGVAKPTAPP